MSTRLFTNRTTDGVSTSKAIPDQVQGEPSFSGTLYAYGVFDGATLSAEGSIDDATWATIPAASLTAVGVIRFTFEGKHVRARVAGAGGLTSITADLAAQTQLT